MCESNMAGDNSVFNFKIQLLEASTLITVWLPHFGQPPSLRAESEQGNAKDGSGSLSESMATLELTMTRL